MEIFRLSKKIYADSLSGIGAARAGGRWNSKGTEIVYTAANRSLAMAEVLVHNLPSLPPNSCMITIFVPDSTSILSLSKEDLPKNWNTFPHPATTQVLGDRFVKENSHCLLKVPSAVTKGDHNYLINPFHPEFKEIKILEIEDFPFDHRLFKS